MIAPIIIFAIGFLLLLFGRIKTFGYDLVGFILITIAFIWAFLKTLKKLSMMYVFFESERSSNHILYTVGFYAPDGTWNSESDHNDKEQAANRCAWLNGSGNKEEGTFKDYISIARMEFVTAVNVQEWNTEMRTEAENILIAYDQMKEKLFIH